MLELDRYISKSDVHRMYHEGLFIHINKILSDENIHTLNSFNEHTINRIIILISLISGNALSYRFVTPFTEQLNKITIDDDSINIKIEDFIRQHKQNNYWEKKKIWVILFIVLLICLAIFFAGE